MANLVAETPAAAAAPGEPKEISAILFEDRDLGTVSIEGLQQYRFQQSEAPAATLGNTSLNVLRNQSTRWHTAAGNLNMFLFQLQRVIEELEANERQGKSPTEILAQQPLSEQGRDQVAPPPGGAAVYSWSYVEKLVTLQNLAADTSEDTASMPPRPDIKIESLLGTLLLSVAKFGSLSAATQKLADLAGQIGTSNAEMGSKVDNQNLAITKIGGCPQGAPGSSEKLCERAASCGQTWAWKLSSGKHHSSCFPDWTRSADGASLSGFAELGKIPGTDILRPPVPPQTRCCAASWTHEDWPFAAMVEP
ncbi:unnamed protein product [Durusdinium trenchii]|uniref:Uncharacterized protein n=1 Tax=Durusdinium trenchii TaxID=1381693 RepID=A0ABP0I0T0_9DINO